MENIKNKRVRAAIYLRVSTDEQANDGYGLVFQEEKLRAFVESQDYILNQENVYRDEGYSGGLPIDKRPGLEQLFIDAEKKLFDVMLVYRLDRFFRKTRLLLEAIERLGVCNVGFRSITESFDTTNITGRFMTTLLAAVAEMERDTIKERTGNGRIAAAKDGRWVMGIPPYGYKIEKKTQHLQIEPVEAANVKKLFHWLTYEKLSLREIQRRANEAGFKTPRQGKSKRLTLLYWHKRTIGRILTSETYAGIAYYRRFKRPFNNLTSLIDLNLQRHKDEWIQIPVPPIITKEQFEMSKKQLLRNREFSIRNLKNTYIFPKLVYCGDCGFKLFGGFQPGREESHVGTKYYHGVYRKPDEVGISKRCPKCPQIAESRLIPVWEKLKELLKDPETALEQIKRHLSTQYDKKAIDDRNEEIEKALVGLQGKKKRLANIYTEDSTMDISMYKTQLEEIRSKETLLKEEKIKLSQALFSKKEVQEQADLLKQLYEKLKAKLDVATDVQKQEIARLFIEKIKVYPKKNEAEIMLNLRPSLPEKQAITRVSGKLLWDKDYG